MTHIMSLLLTFFSFFAVVSAELACTVDDPAGLGPGAFHGQDRIRLFRKLQAPLAVLLHRPLLLTFVVILFVWPAGTLIDVEGSRKSLAALQQDLVMLRRLAEAKDRGHPETDKIFADCAAQREVIFGLQDRNRVLAGMWPGGEFWKLRWEAVEGVDELRKRVYGLPAADDKSNDDYDDDSH